MVDKSGSRLTTSLAVLVSLTVVSFSQADVTDTLCARETFARLAQKLKSTEAPLLQSLKSDLPRIADPIEYIAAFTARREIWNAAHPANLNNFSAPEMLDGVNGVIKSLRKINRPVQNRAAAERIARELSALGQNGFPYRDSLIKLHEALAVVSMKFPRTNEGASQLFDRAMFFKQNADYFADFEKLMGLEIFVVTAKNQTIDGLAESTLLGLRAMQTSERPAMIDRRWMNALERLQHDVAHAMIPGRDPVTQAIMGLPFQDRLAILKAIEVLPTERERSLARFSVYQTAHEYGTDSRIMNRFSVGSAPAVQDEYIEATKKQLTASEAAWLQNWYAENIGRRLARSR